MINTEPLEAFLPQALSEVSPDWTSRTYGGKTTIRLSFINPTDPDLRAYGVGPTFAAAARDALKDARSLLKS